MDTSTDKNEIEEKIFNDTYNTLCFNLPHTDHCYTVSYLLKDNKVIKLILNYSKTITREYLDGIFQQADTLDADSIIMIGEDKLLNVNFPQEKVLVDKIYSGEISFATVPGKEDYLFGVLIKDQFKQIKSKISPIKKDLRGKRYIDDEILLDYFILDNPIIVHQ